MRVGLDATPLSGGTGGVPRYVRELKKAMEELDGPDEFLFFTDQPVPGAIGPEPGPLGRRWWLAGLPMALRRKRIDVFHGTDYSVPYVPVCPSVLSLHDLSPWMDSSWHGKEAQRVRMRTPILLRLGLATMILTLSEAVRRRVIARFRLKPERVVAVPLAASANFFPVETPPPREPYFLYVGTLEPRKNLPLLVRAWRRVRQAHKVRLVLAGRQREDGPKFEPEEGLEILGAVEEQELPRVYSGALAAVYPTFYEGFGLPVIEAMQCGAPVITSTDESVLEVSAGAALHCDANDEELWVKTLKEIFENASLRESLREKGLKRAANFSWRRTAKETLAVYEEAIRRRS